MYKFCSDHMHVSFAQDFMANELQIELERFNNQARFVQMIVDKELIISNRKKLDIVEELRKKQFRAFPKVSKAKAAGETEAVVEEDDEEEGSASNGVPVSRDYDYLLGMPIWSLTKEKAGIATLHIATSLMVIFITD